SNVSDSLPSRLWTIIEAKSGSTLSAHARKQFIDHVKAAGKIGSSLFLMFGQQPTAATQRWIKRTLDQLRADGAPMPTAFCAKYSPTMPQPGEPRPTTPPVDPNLDGSADSPEQQQLQDEIEQTLDQEQNPTPAQPQQPAPAPSGAPVNQ